MVVFDASGMLVGWCFCPKARARPPAGFRAGADWWGRTLTATRLVDIAGELRHETERAFLLFDGARTVWLPKSQVEHHPEDGVFVMPEWLAKEKELI